MDPYVKLQFGNKTFRSKTHNSAGKHPTWYDVFECQRTNEDVLYATVYDEDLTSDDLVGSGTLDIKSICNGSTHTFSNYIKIYYKGKEAGDLFLDVTFQPSAPGYGAGYAAQPAYGVAQPAYGALQHAYSGAVPQPMYGAQQMYGAQPMYGAASSQPMYAPASSQPMYGAASSQPMYAPAGTQPMYAPAGTQPTYASTQPMYGSAGTQPMYAPAGIQPTYASTQPMYGSAGTQPTYAPTGTIN